MHDFLNRRYALALYEVAEEKNKVDDFLETLRDITELIIKNDELMELVRSPHLSTSKKKEVFSSIFKGKIDEEILTFLDILIEKDRILNLNEILDAMKGIYLERHNTLVAYVKTVVPLNEEERSDLIRNLHNKYNKTILLNEEIDKSIIGGAYVRVGNDVIDGTIRSKFDEIRKLTLKVE